MFKLFICIVIIDMACFFLCHLFVLFSFFSCLWMYAALLLGQYKYGFIHLTSLFYFLGVGLSGVYSMQLQLFTVYFQWYYTTLYRIEEFYSNILTLSSSLCAIVTRFSYRCYESHIHCYYFCLDSSVIFKTFFKSEKVSSIYPHIDYFWHSSFLCEFPSGIISFIEITFCNCLW